jgi:hypothetical protein
MTEQRFPFYFTTCMDRTYEVSSFDGENNIKLIKSENTKDTIGSLYTETKKEIQNYIDQYVILYENPCPQEPTELEVAHDIIRTVLGLKEDAPKRFDYYAELIDGIVGAKMSAELSNEWDHLDLMSLVRYLRSRGYSNEEIKNISREWMK